MFSLEVASEEVGLSISRETWIPVYFGPEPRSPPISSPEPRSPNPLWDPQQCQLISLGLGPRVKVIISNSLLVSIRIELNFSLKTAFLWLVIIFKWQLPNGDVSS